MTPSDHQRIAPPLRLNPSAYAKPWGRMELGDWGLQLCHGRHDAVIGEIHHGAARMNNDALLLKTLFTSEPLSVQVHPDLHAARALGLERGKDEAWVVLAADAGATIGLGLIAPVNPATLRAAAIDGSIVDLVHWHACRAGDVFFVPAGTLHAIGAGVTLFEVQQNCDITYRLYDYGRPRELQLEEALAVARCEDWRASPPPTALSPGRTLLVNGPHFVLERLQLEGTMTLAAPETRWLAIIDGAGRCGGEPFQKGEVWKIDCPAMLHGAADLLIAYASAAAPA